MKAKKESFLRVHDSEIVAPVDVPLDAGRGDLLYAVEVGPRTLGPILAATASQAQSWAGDFTFQLYVNGSVNAKNYAIARWLPDAKLSSIPAGGIALWKLARGKTQREGTKNIRDKAHIKYNVVSNQYAEVHACWEQSYNPKKPVVDDDPTEMNLGVFIIVANGPPGEAIVIDVEVRYDVFLMGPVPTEVVVDRSVRVNANPTSVSILFGPTATQVGEGLLVLTSNSFSVRDGKYLVTHAFVGTAMTAPPSFSVSSGTISALSLAVSATSMIATYVLTVSPGPAVVTLGSIIATTLTSHTLRLAPYSST